jgi:hypothetical protein
MRMEISCRQWANLSKHGLWGVSATPANLASQEDSNHHNYTSASHKDDVAQIQRSPNQLLHSSILMWAMAQRAMHFHLGAATQGVFTRQLKAGTIQEVKEVRIYAASGDRIWYDRSRWVRGQAHRISM